MATENEAYRLSPEQQELLNAWSARTGRPVAELISEAIESFAKRVGANGDGPTTSLADRLRGAGLMGCLSGGPSDLSTNPDHFEGFGK